MPFLRLLPPDGKAEPAPAPRDSPSPDAAVRPLVTGAAGPGPGRCRHGLALEVRPVFPSAPAVFENAIALCPDCRSVRSSPHPADEHTRRRTLKRAAGRCECTRGWGCH